VAENSAFFSVWAQDSPYWMVVEGLAAAKLPGFTPVHHKPHLCARRAEANWAEDWIALAAELRRHAPPDGVGHTGAIIAADTLPALPEITAALRKIGEIDAIANNLWLVDYVNHGRLGCYMQRVLDRRGKTIGYEAFARMEAPDGGVIGGGAIMQAAGALRVEYQLDRLLHKQAIESFVESDLEGYIFINFLTGFIHRPEVYLEGLSQAATRFHIRANAVVLDVPITAEGMDLAKLRTIAAYCRTRGFAMALDDVTGTDGLSTLLGELRPAIVKLDGKFGAGLTPQRRAATLREIVRLTHEAGASVLAEGVESRDLYDTYFAADIDMFQGYLFGAPERFPKETPPDAKHAQ
jgi:EAL domain-containing protein (putative c-di-GMP-specific phosphodiesterase class I)